MKDIINKDSRFRYQLLGRMQSDCEYFLNYGNRSIKHLWSGNVKEHIKDMKTLFKSFKKSERPEWLSMKDILSYENQMIG